MLLRIADSGGHKSERRAEAADIADYYAKFDGRLPAALTKQLQGLRQRLG